MYLQIFFSTIKKMPWLGYFLQGWRLLSTKKRTKAASSRLRPVPAPEESSRPIEGIFGNVQLPELESNST